MNIYFSNLDIIKFQNNNSGGIGTLSYPFLPLPRPDYTQIDAKDLTAFKGEFPIQVPQTDVISQPEPVQSYQPQYQNGGGTYDQFAERSVSNNSQSQPHSGQSKPFKLSRAPQWGPKLLQEEVHPHPKHRESISDFLTWEEVPTRNFSRAINYNDFVIAIP